MLLLLGNAGTPEMDINGSGVLFNLKRKTRRRGSAGGLGRGLARDRVDPRLERSLTQRDARVEWRKEP
jgi:hypothetical protein